MSQTEPEPEESPEDSPDNAEGSPDSDIELFDDVQQVPVEDISPYDRNPNLHPPSQIDAIADSIREFGFTVPLVIDSSGTIVAGHGRYEAATDRLDLSVVPCIERDDMTEDEIRAYRIADNRVAESDWDDDLLAGELQDLDDSGLDDLLGATGFTDDELDDLLESPDDDDLLALDDERFTQKIDTPTYEPRGEQPEMDDLYDTTHYDRLTERIDEKADDLPDDLERFLRLAAHRHIVFDYENIAEYYAHRDPSVQDLMEDLTLVILDYDSAIEQGYIDFTVDALRGEGGPPTPEEEDTGDDND